MKAWIASIPKLKKILIFILFGLSVLFLFYLFYQSWLYWTSIDGLTEAKDRFTVKNDFIKTVAQVLGGGFFLFGLYLAWKNLIVAQEKQTTDLYTKAIEQLGNDKLEIRLGGIFALERIARNSEKDHWPIIEVLTAYVRENAPWPPENPTDRIKKRPWSKTRYNGITSPSYSALFFPKLNFKHDPDIQAILTVLGQRKYHYGQGETHRLDLSSSDLRGANLSGAHLEGAWLKGTHLEEANLRGAHLEEANLSYAHLERAWINDAYLDGAYLNEANLEETNLSNACLELANFYEANLQRAGLIGANMKNTLLIEANLKGAFLMDTKGLTREQLAVAIIDEETRKTLPDYLREPQLEKSEPK